MSSSSTVARGAAIIAAGTLTSRLLGWLREKLLLSTFGASFITGAYNSAFSVPDLLYYLLAGGALSAAFIPVFSDFLAKKQPEDANRTGSSIANLMLLALIAGVALELIFAPYVVRLVAPGYAPGTQEFQLTVYLTRVMCGMVIFTAMSGLLTGMLNSYHHFLAPTVVWNTYNIGIILGITVFSKWSIFGGSPAHPSIVGVAAGVMVGALSMALIQIPVVMKYGFRYSCIIDLAHAGTKRVLQLFAPVMVGLSLSQLNLQMIPLMIGSIAGTTAVTDIRAANRIVLLPLGIFAVAISTAAFPRLSQLAALGETQEFRRTISSALRAILLLSIPSAMMIFVLATPMTCLLWGGGKFGMEDIRAASFTLAFFIWVLLALGAIQLINRAFYSLQDTFTPVIVGVIMVLLNIPTGLFFVKYTPLAYGGVAFSTTATTTVFTIVLFELLRRRLGGIDGRALLTTTLKICAASVAMAVVVYLIAYRLAPVLADGTHLSPIYRLHWHAPAITANKTLNELGELKIPVRKVVVQIGASMIAGLLVYLLALWAMGVEELSLVTARFRKKARI